MLQLQLEGWHIRCPIIMSKLKQWRKSWTINYGLLLVILGSLQQNFDYLRKLIGEENYGLAFVAVGIVVVVLRFKTTTAVEDK